MAYASGMLAQVVAVTNSCSTSSHTDCSTLEATSAIGFEIVLASMEHVGSYSYDRIHNEKEELEGRDLDHWADNYSIVDRRNSLSVSMRLGCRSESMRVHLHNSI